MIRGRVEVDLSPLQGLKKNFVRKILTKALRQAAKPVKDAVKANAQAIKRYGFEAKSIGVKLSIKKDKAVALVGPRSHFIKERGVYTRGKHKGEARMIRPSWYAHLLESGSRRSRARPFLGPAIDSTESQYLELLSSGIRAGIEEQLSKSKG